MNTTANKITIMRIILVPVFMVLLYMGYTYWALAVYIIACLSDFIDGKIARKYNQVTNFGKFMDPLADKMLVLTAMCYFVDNNTMSGWVVALVLLREFGVSGLRLLIVVAEPWVPFKEVIPPVCSALIVISTLYSGAEYFVKNINVFKRCD